MCQQCPEDVRVGGRRAGHVRIDQTRLAGAPREFGGVDQISVVAQRNSGTGGGVSEDRLGVLPGGRTGRGVTAVPDGDVAAAHGPRGLAAATEEVEAERAIEAAKAWMRGDLAELPVDLDSEAAIEAALRRVLPPGDDEFWPRWVIHTRGNKGP